MPPIGAAEAAVANPARSWPPRSRLMRLARGTRTIVGRPIWSRGGHWLWTVARMPGDEVTGRSEPGPRMAPSDASVASPGCGAALVTLLPQVMTCGRSSLISRAALPAPRTAVGHGEVSADPGPGPGVPGTTWPRPCECELGVLDHDDGRPGVRPRRRPGRPERRWAHPVRVGYWRFLAMRPGPRQSSASMRR
jgi:hypothetical protein